MAGPTRLELATSCVTGRRSNRTELRPRELTLKNAHLRRQELKFELQRTTQYASAQILIPSLHLDIFERQLFYYCHNTLRYNPQKIFNVRHSTPQLNSHVLPCTWAFLSENSSRYVTSRYYGIHGNNFKKYCQ